MISVIIPALNAALTIGRAIGSIIEQDLPIQLIVVDDGSTDGTSEVARAFGIVEVITNFSSLGPAAARNLGLSIAEGEWTIFLDADDIILPFTLKRRLDTAASSGADVIIADWEEEREPAGPGGIAIVKQFDWISFTADPELATATVSWAAIHAILYRTQILRDLGGFRTHLHVAEDARLLFDCVRSRARFAHSPHVGGRYIYSALSQSRANQGRFYANVFRNLSEIMRIWEGEGAFTAARQLALTKAFYDCERGLFAAADPLYFEVYGKRNQLGFPPPLHSRVALPLSRLVGLRAARVLLAMLGK